MSVSTWARRVRVRADLPVVGASVQRAAANASAAAPVPVPAREFYLQAIIGGPLDLSPASVGPRVHDAAVASAVEALASRGGDPAARLRQLREIRDELVRTHATPYELVHAVLEAEAAVALEAARSGRPCATSAGSTSAASGPTGDGPVVLDARSWPADTGADPVSLLRAVRGVAGGRDVVALVDCDEDAVAVKGLADGALADAALVDRVEAVPDRLVRLRPSGLVALDVLGAPAPAAARVAALRGCASIGVVHDLATWERPGDAADWLRVRARAALLHDMDLVLAGDAGVADGLVRWLGLPAGRIAVLGGRTPEPRSDVTPVDHIRTVHCLASGRTVDDVACVVMAAAIATATDDAPRRVLVHGDLPPGAGPRLDHLCRDLGRHAPVLEVLPGNAAAPAVGDVVVDASHDAHHVRAAVALAGGSVPVVAVRGSATVEILGDGPWLVAARAPAAVAALLSSSVDAPGGPVGVAAGQLARARAAAAGRRAAVDEAVCRVLAPRAGDPAPDVAPHTPATSVALCSMSSGALLDLLVVRALGSRAGIDLASVDHESRPRGAGRPVAPLDASLLVRPDPGDVLVAITDNRADLVGLAVAEAYGVPVLTAEPALFAIHIDTRGPHATVPLVATEAVDLTPHELVVLRLSGSVPASTGLRDLSRRVRALLVTSDDICARVRAEGGDAEVVGLPSRPPAAGQSPLDRTTARDDLSLDQEALVICCLSGVGDRSRSADRVIAAAGWLVLWGHPVTVVLPSWLPDAERERLAVVAEQLRCVPPPVYARGTIDRVVAAADVVVSLSAQGTRSGLEDLWTAGAALLTTGPVVAGSRTSSRSVMDSATPLLLAEEVLAMVAADDRDVTSPEPDGPRLESAEWAARLLGHIEGVS